MSNDGSIFGLSPQGGSPKKPKNKPEQRVEQQDQEPKKAPEAASKTPEAAPKGDAQAAQPEGEPKKKPRRRRGPRKRKPKTDQAPAVADTDEAGEKMPKDSPAETEQAARGNVESLAYAMSFRQVAKGGAQDEEEPEAPAVDEAPEAQDAREAIPAEAAEPQPAPGAPVESPAEAVEEPKAQPEAAPEASAEPEEAHEDVRETAEAAPEAPAQPARTKRPVSYTEVFASATPDEVVQPENSLPEITLDDLSETLQSACRQAGWDQLMPVQSMAVPYLLAGRDLMIQSRTGSGKTGAFVLPVLDRIDISRDECQALALVPTRELAIQVAQEAETLFKGTGARIATVYGGTGYGKQLDDLKQGAHFVVGTPGRVLDHLLRRSFTLDGIKILVFDEADRMLSIGFYPDMKQVQRYLPERKVNMFMTSATYPPHVMRLAGEFMENPQLLSLSHSNVHVAETPHSYYEVNSMEKDRTLVRIIETENPASAFIFCNTKQNVHYITAVLQRFGYDADELSGDLSQNKREQVLGRIRRGELRFLVATDVAARGIDIPDLSHVFLYEPPEDHEVYIHRAGRTGRAGASGEVISLVDVMEKMALERIGKMYKINFEHREPPTDEDVQKVVAMRMTALLESRLRTLDNVQHERLSRYEALAASLNESEDGRKLMAMLLDDVYMPTLGKKAEAPAEEKPKPARPRGGRGKRPTRQDGPRRRDDAPRQDAAPRQDDDNRPQAQQASGDDAPKPKRRRRRRPRRRKPSGGNDGGGNNESNGNVAD